MQECPTFHQFASEWFASRQHELRPATLAAYECRQPTHHLLPFFATKPVDRIGEADVDAYRQSKVAAGKLAPASINRTIARLGAILDVAQERSLIVQNPVRINPRNRKVKSVRPKRPWLEPHEVVSLLDAAGSSTARTSAASDPSPPVAVLAWGGLRVGEGRARCGGVTSTWPPERSASTKARPRQPPASWTYSPSCATSW